MDFLRYCELIIGPLADWQGGGSSNEAIRIIADGSNSRLRVAFSAQKTITGSPNQIDIAVYGLSRDTQRAIRSNLTKIQLIAGYESSADSAGLVAQGAIMSAIPSRQGADQVLKITAFDGYGGMVRGAFSKYFDGGTPIASVVREIAQSMPGVNVERIDIPGTLRGRGANLSGSSTQQLDKLADQHGFSWSVQDGVFQAVPDNTDTGRVFVFSSQRNLISANPVLNGPLMANVGVEAEAKFDARMKPGDRMIIESDINPEINGSYKATGVNLSFDSHGPATLKAESLRVM